MVGRALYEASGLAAIVGALNNPSPESFVGAAVSASPLGRLGPLFRAGCQAQQVARELGIRGNARATRDGRGIRFQEATASVRVMRGNPRSPNPSQQIPYVTVRDRTGAVLDERGRAIKATDEFRNPSQSPRSHIPIDRFNPENFRK